MSAILLVSEARAVGGAEVYLERLAREIRGHDFTLAVPERLSASGWPDHLRRSGLRVASWSGSLTGLPALVRLARGHDLVHLNLPSTYDGSAGLLGAGLALLGGGRPVISTEHLTLLPRSRRRRAAKLATAGCLGRVITVSEASRAALLREGMPPGRVAVVPNGVPDPGPPAPPPPLQGPLRIAVVATLEPRKQVDLLLEAAAGSGERVRVEVVGDGPRRGELEALAGRLGGNLEARFHGRVEGVGEILASCHCLALPSRLEAMPLSILEALAAGRGVLASALPGMQEIVTEGVTGRLLPPGDPAAWSAAMVDLCGAPGTIAAWGENARRDYEARFTLERCARLTAEIYAEVLGAGR